MQLGFVIDHTRCIGCHACTVACKAENDVPLGSFRTWVKYTERGTFPEVRRSFAVLRCNQCSDAPCVTICPVRALSKRDDGIVDIDPAVCIGCKACMQACPYDALYIDARSGTAAKCHFCAHRVEAGLAPACAVVCPTEAIIPGDLHDPQSVVSRLRRDHDLQVRKAEAGTGPNVFYREVDEAGIDPALTGAGSQHLWAERPPALVERDAAVAAALGDAERKARTTYDVEHAPVWGWRVTAYLFTKSLAAGLFLVLPLLLTRAVSDEPPPIGALVGLTAWSLVWLMLTLVLLVADLKRPARFALILLRPNPSSWLVRGAWILGGFVLVQAIWMALLLGGRLDETLVIALLGTATVLAVATAGYTGRLFGQAHGRALWLRRWLGTHLVAQAVLGGAAFTLLAAPGLELAGAPLAAVRWLLVVALVVHGAFMLSDARLAPRGREAEYRRAHRVLTHGALGRRRRVGALGVGIVLPTLMLVSASSPTAWAAAGLAALIGLWIDEDLLVRGGQMIPIS